MPSVPTTTLTSLRQHSLFQPESAPEPWELLADEDRLIASIVFNLPVTTEFDYVIPENLRELASAGQRMRVPFGKGNRSTLGYCVRVAPGVSRSRKLKSVNEICDREPLLSAEMLQLSQWIANRYLCGWGQVLEGMIPAGVKKQSGTREITCYELAPNLDLATLKLPRKQQAVVDVLSNRLEPVPIQELTDAAECGVSPIDALRRKDVIVPIRRRTAPSASDSAVCEPQQDLQLNAEQQRGLDAILAALREQRHETLLLQGVTGSGKTEVYIQAIREVVSYGRQAIVLVPEISLTPQTIRRFRSRFPNVAVLHSHLSDADRHWHWQQIAHGDVQVVVGARSAIFAPLPHLGIIVIDEEHESTFKQQSTPRYHAREVARERARRCGIPLVLGSATPTLESLARAEAGQDRLIRLEKRVADRPLPPVSIVDVRNDPFIAKRHAMGRALTNAIRAAIEQGGQAILFLNLRGFSPVLWCGRCGGIRCPDCDVTLTFHRDRNALLCHSCEYQSPPPERCPTCEQPGLRYLGTGTQRLETEVKARFPQARILRMDSDSMKGAGAHDAALESFRRGEVDILLGTQMIAKGLDFPNVTLVGVIDADTLLHQPDFRSGERTFQLITQVAGRTGRGSLGGRVLVQTMSPDEPVIRFSARHDFEGFARWELQNRRQHSMPPFSTMARVILRSIDDATAQAEARRVCSHLREAAKKEFPGVRILGPAPAPVARLRKHYRYHLQLTGATPEEVQQLWLTQGAPFKLAADVELTVDLDPTDLR